MRIIKAFIKTTLLGGPLIVLPIVILILVMNWLYRFVDDKLKPLTYLLSETVQRYGPEESIKINRIPDQFVSRRIV